MLNKTILGGLSALALLVGAHAGFAQDRTNPFIAPTTEQEEQARMDERVRNIVWELQPELKSLIMQDVSATQASLEIKMRRRIDAAVEDVKADVTRQVPVSVAGGPDGEIAGEDSIASQGELAVDSSIIDNSTFISCVNGKALYRDSNNTLFQVANSGNGNQPCGS